VTAVVTRPLRILAWDHPRATAPLIACSEAWRRLTGEELVITTRSLQSFGDDVPAADGADLVLIDHPHVGRAAADGSIVALDGLLAADALEELAGDSAGPSHASYVYRERPWAVRVDASCQALALAADAVDALPPRPTWDDVVALSEDRRGQVALPLSPPHAISALLSLIAARDGAIGGPRLTSPEVLEWATATLAALAAAGPDEAFAWEPPEALARLATGELTCVPLVYAYVGYDVAWRPAPSLERHGYPGSILGGVGAAVLSGSADPGAAARLAAWLGSSPVQLEVVRVAGGQPATRSGWTAPGGDPLFADVLSTLEASLVRPNDPWWPAFQRAAGDLLARGLTARREPPRLAADLARAYHDHREAPA
jgi:multiple sugar transport system substrate-binding protein